MPHSGSLKQPTHTDRAGRRLTQEPSGSLHTQTEQEDASLGSLADQALVLAGSLSQQHSLHTSSGLEDA